MKDARRHCSAGAALALAAVLVSACGGGGGGGGSPAPTPNPPAGSGWVAGQFAASDSYAAQCAAPRTGNDPDGVPYPDTQGTRLDENNFLRSWTNELYLWYDEVVDRNPAGTYTDPRTGLPSQYDASLDATLDYFDTLQTNATTPSGAAKDKFHFTYDTAVWESLSGSGISAGYGAEFEVLAGRPPREVVVSLVQPGTPASDAGLTRGDRILEVDGNDLVNGNTQAIVDALVAGLYPETLNETHAFVVRHLNPALPDEPISMTSQEITIDPVQFVTTVQSPGGANVGYLLFTDHIFPAELQLVDAIDQLAAANIDDLVLDIRYNGGGFLAIASQLAYMIAGPAQTNGQIFEAVQFSDKHPNVNPVTGAPLLPYGFADVTLGLSDPAVDGTSLPSLNLGRVFVLTGPGTCSASESIMNSLRGIGVEVIQIGETTCGKPYGFYPQDNCGTTFFSIQFRGVNALNFGDYTDGFAPSDGPVGTAGADLPGCAVLDDFDHGFADPAEDLLRTALEFRDNPVCPPTAAPLTLELESRSERTDGIALRGPPTRDNRILGSW
jgi:C-terminal processing protease CtpA/Prc